MPDSPPSPRPQNAPWYAGVTRYQWLVLLIASLGWIFDIFDNQSTLFYWFALPAFGFLVSGMHAGYAVYFPELFPARLRSTGAGFCFNAGRLLAAPVLILRGLLINDYGWTLSKTNATLSCLFLLGFVVLLFAPETRDRDLPE